MKKIIIISILIVSTLLLFGQNKVQTNKLDNILKQLSLTEQQQKQVDKIQAKYQSKEQGPLLKSANNAPLTQETVVKNMEANHAIQSEKMKEIRAVLTPEQKVKLRELRGAKKVEKTKK